ncbi:MAG: diacylglycerol/lipid kinase family protein [Sphingomicrobium sp.]
MTETLPKQAILIVNAGSRRGADAFEEARDKLVEAGIDLIDAQAVTEPETMGDAVKAAVARAPMVIVGGGDGSLSSNIEHFMGSETIFALLPLGTANSFARTMQIPLELDGAIAVIAGGEPRSITLGCINGNHFLNAAALGLAPMVAETVPHGLKRRLGRLGYLMWAGWSAANFNAFRVTVENGRARHRLWGTEVRIANGRFHGGMELIESADPESSEMVVQVVRGRSVFRLGVSYLASALKLRKRKQTLREFRGQKLRLATRPPLQVSIDGEVGPSTPLEISSIPGGVTMAAPPNRRD